jgi:hypothetical protein
MQPCGFCLNNPSHQSTSQFCRASEYIRQKELLIAEAVQEGAKLKAAALPTACAKRPDGCATGAQEGEQASRRAHLGMRHQVGNRRQEASAADK